MDVGMHCQSSSCTCAIVCAKDSWIRLTLSQHGVACGLANNLPRVMSGITSGGSRAGTSQCDAVTVCGPILRWTRKGRGGVDDVARALHHACFIYSC
jgi:hypothetical protein